MLHINKISARNLSTSYISTDNMVDHIHISQVTDCVLEKLASRGLLERLVIHTCLEVTEAGRHVTDLT